MLAAAATAAAAAAMLEAAAAALAGIGAHFSLSFLPLKPTPDPFLLPSWDLADPDAPLPPPTHPLNRPLIPKE
jgi:hypothetical protein